MHVSIRINITDVAGNRVKPVNCPVIDHNAAVSAVMKEISSYRKNRIALLCQLRGIVKVLIIIGVPGYLAPEL